MQGAYFCSIENRIYGPLLTSSPGNNLDQAKFLSSFASLLWGENSNESCIHGVNFSRTLEMRNACNHDLMKFKDFMQGILINFYLVPTPFTAFYGWRDQLC